jgi:hypothetical protein
LHDYGPFDEPHVAELSVRMLFLKKKMPEHDALMVLGLKGSLLGGCAGTRVRWVYWYPARPGHTLWIEFRHDEQSRKMLLHEIKIE